MRLIDEPTMREVAPWLEAALGGPAPLDLDAPDAVDRLADAVGRADLPEDEPISALVPGCRLLTGPVPWPRVPGLIKGKLAGGGVRQWEDLLEFSVTRILSRHGAGVRNVEQTIAFVLLETLHALSAPPAAPVGRPVGSRSSLAAVLLQLAGEAAVRYPEGSLYEALASLFGEGLPGPVRRPLEGLDAGLAARWAAPVFNPLEQLQRLIAALDAREQRILDARGLPPDRHQRLTLEELGAEFQLTRERVRQLEVGLLERLQNGYESLCRGPLGEWAQGLAEAIGTVCHDSDVVEALHGAGAAGARPPEGQVALHLIGPFRFEGDWLVAQRIAAWPHALSAAVESAMGEDVVITVDAASDALASLGIRGQHHAELLEQLPGFRRWDEERMVRWGGSLEDRAEIVLRLVGHPLRSQEISDRIPEKHSVRSLKNELAANPRFVRSARDTWALAAWGAAEYPGVAPAILAELEAGPLPLTALISRLGEKFAIPEASVRMVVGQSPSIVVEGDLVRLRRPDEPYSSPFAIEEARGCFLVHGSWALRIRVDADVLRGSGRPVPEPFALLLGLQPGQRITVDAGLKEVVFAWKHHRPYSGSFRHIAEQLGALPGDLLFLRAVAPGSLAVDFVRDPESGLDAETSVRRLIGAPFGRQPLLEAVAAALGLEEADADTIWACVSKRGDDELKVLLTEAAAGY